MKFGRSTRCDQLPLPDLRAVMTGQVPAALIAHGDRRPLLRRIHCPTTVMHGRDDPLIPFACGEDVADNIPGSIFWPVEGMGHDFPLALTSVFADAICSTTMHKRHDSVQPSRGDSLRS